MFDEQYKPKYFVILKCISRYFGFFMVFVYLTLGVFMVTSDFFLNTMNKLQKNSIGIILIIYGIFRAYRIYKENKK